MRVRVCGSVNGDVCVCVFVCSPICVRARARLCVRVCVYRSAGTGGIHSTAGGRRGPPVPLVPPAGCRARSAAGVTWTSRTASAGWAARAYHTSVVDAAGAIFVIGGGGFTGYGGTFFQDVWASTDGGAQARLGQRGRSVGTRGVLRGTRGYLGVV